MYRLINRLRDDHWVTVLADRIPDLDAAMDDAAEFACALDRNVLVQAWDEGGQHWYDHGMVRPCAWCQAAAAQDNEDGFF